MANRIPEVSPVLDEAGLPLHGFCRFEEIRPYLLSCRAASRIPAAACTVIIALFPYRFPDDGGPRNLSFYACVPDYHRVAADVLRRAAGQLARWEVLLSPGYANLARILTDLTEVVEAADPDVV